MNLGSLEGAVLPILGAVIAGGVIGFEREWRGRAAGLRTHILVSLASALLMLAAMSQADWAFRALPDENIVTDPTRMAHGVLTGIGFLCAGVIFRTGFSIHGLTTAASLWITSAIGILFGAGLYALGAAATVVTALILIGLKLISGRLPAHRGGRRSVLGTARGVAGAGDRGGAESHRCGRATRPVRADRWTDRSTDLAIEGRRGKPAEAAGGTAVRHTGRGRLQPGPARRLKPFIAR